MQKKEVIKQTPVRHVPKAIAFMIASGLTFSASGILLKASARELPAMEAAFFRNIFGLAVVLGMAMLGIKKIPKPQRPVMLFWRGLFGALGLVTFVWAVLRMELGLTTALNQSSPVFVAILAALFLGERFGWTSYLFTIIAFTGIILIVSPDLSQITTEALVALSSGIFAGIAYTIVRSLRTTEHPQTIVFSFMLAGTLLPLAFAFTGDWVMPPTWLHLVGLIFVGVFGYLGQLCLSYAYRFAEATIVAPFIYASTLNSLIFAFILWGEAPSTTALIGCALLIVAAIGISRAKPKGSKHADEKIPTPGNP